MNVLAHVFPPPAPSRPAPLDPEAGAVKDPHSDARWLDFVIQRCNRITHLYFDRFVPYCRYEL